MEMTEEQRQRHYEKLAHYINTVRGYAHLTGIRVTKVDRDYCEGELDITPDKCNYLGIVHGGCRPPWRIQWLALPPAPPATEP